MHGINSSFEVKSRYCFINRSPPGARGLHILSADRDNSSKSVSVINEGARRAGKYSMQSHLSQSKVNFALGQQDFTHNSTTVGNVILKAEKLCKLQGFISKFWLNLIFRLFHASSQHPRTNIIRLLTNAFSLDGYDTSSSPIYSP